MKYISLFIFFIACHFAHAVNVATPIFWQRSFYMNISDPDASGFLIASSSYMVSSLDFQGINVEADQENTVKKIVFNFGDCCKASNTSLATLQSLNSNSIKETSLKGAEQLALVKRGGCNWSEKVAVVNDLALLNDINVTSIFIYDNETYSDISINAQLITGFGTASPSGSANDLPAARNVLNMADNDLTSFTIYPTIYFVPNQYGQTLIQNLATMYNASTPYLRTYWLITPYFDDVTWGDSMNFFSTSKGYIAYIIILAVIFITAFAFLRWWRLRRRRRAINNGFFDGASGIRLQSRMNQVDPLPVDIVNRLPIDTYSEDLIKNVNCAICLEDFVPGKNDIRILPCGHGFCVLCIDPWLTQKSTLCPICKWDCLPVDLRRERDINEEQQPHIEDVARRTEHHEHVATQTEPPVINSAVGGSPPSSPHVRKVDVAQNENSTAITISNDEDRELFENQASSSNSVHSPDFTAIDVSKEEHKKNEL